MQDVVAIDEMMLQRTQDMQREQDIQYLYAGPVRINELAGQLPVTGQRQEGPVEEAEKEDVASGGAGSGPSRTRYP